MLKNHPSGCNFDCFRGIHTLIFSGSVITSLCAQNFFTGGGIRDLLKLLVVGLGNISILPLECNTMMCNTEYHRYFDNTAISYVQYYCTFT